MEYRATKSRVVNHAALRLVEPSRDSSSRRWREPDPTSLDIVIVERGNRLSCQYAPLYDYLGIQVRVARTAVQLASALRENRPIAVIAEMDAGVLDGCDVLSIVAARDSELPVLVLADEHPLMLGAVDAAVEHLRMHRVKTYARTPSAQDVVEFLCRSGLQASVDTPAPTRSVCL